MEKKPTLLTINWQDPQHPAAGGAEIHAWEVTRRLAQKGVHCVLYCCGFAGAPSDEVIDGIAIHRRGTRSFFNFTVYTSVRRWVKQEDPAWVIDDSNKIPFFLPWLLPHHKVLVRIQHVFGKAIFHETGFASGMYVYLSEKLATHSWQKAPVITFSESSRDELHGFGVKDVSLTYHGIDKGLYTKGLPAKEPFLIGYLGRVKKYKGLSVLLKSVALLVQRWPQLRCEIAGGGDDRARLEAEAISLGIEKHIKFLGFVDDVGKVEFYRRCSIVINCSRKEGWGLTTIEANACGTVVVASDVHGLRDSVVDRKTGFLFPFGDAKSLSHSIEKLFDHPDLQCEMERAAWERSQTFDWERTANDTYAVLQRLH